MEPTVDAIGAAATALKVERITGFDRLPDRGECMWPVIRMKRVSLSPPSQFLLRMLEAGGLIPLLKSGPEGPMGQAFPGAATR